MTTNREVRAAFWAMFGSHANQCRRGPRGRILPQNEQPTDTRDFVDGLARDGIISESLAQRVTL